MPRSPLLGFLYVFNDVKTLCELKLSARGIYTFLFTDDDRLLPVGVRKNDRKKRQKRKKRKKRKKESKQAIKKERKVVIEGVN